MRGIFFQYWLTLQFLFLSSDAQVAVFPSEAVAALGRDATFTCISPSTIVSVEWLINGTSLNELQLTGVSQERTITLRFRNVSAEYNNTQILCKANTILSTEPAYLIVQGLLSAVGSPLVDAHVDHIHVSWTAPFTLDITTTAIDITYCVDVVSSTSSATLHSECGINVTEFTYPLPHRSGCDEYNFTVTPVNVVGNGTAVSRGFPNDVAGPEIVEVTNTAHRTTILNMSAFVCSARLTLEDSANGKNVTIGGSDLNITGRTIAFNSQLLTQNRKYTAEVSASNTHGHTVSSTLISTHDIVSFSTIQNDASITVIVNFTEQSEATGALLNFIFINDDNITANFNKSRIFAADRVNVSNGLTLPLNIWSPGQYMLYAYDIESNKRIMNGLQYQANSNNFTVENGQGIRTTLFQTSNCRLSDHKKTIRVACSLLKRFQVTAQLNAPNSVNILHVNTSINFYTVTLQVSEYGEYLVTILPILDGRGILTGSAFSQVHLVLGTDDVTMSTQGDNDDSAGGRTVGLAVGLTVGLTVIILIVIAIVLVIIRKKTSTKVSFEP